MLSGSTGNQGVSTALDVEGLKITNHELQPRSPGDSAKMSRRAAMHITGPTLVTVPLHITTNLAFGVLQRGGGDKIIHYGRDKEGKDKVPDKEKAEEVGTQDEEGGKRDKVSVDEATEVCGGIQGEGEGTKEQGKQEKEEDCGFEPEMVTADVSREQPHVPPTHCEEAEVVNNNTDNDEDNEYMGKHRVHYQSTTTRHISYHASIHAPNHASLCSTVAPYHRTTYLCEISSIFTLDPVSLCFYCRV